MPKNANICKEYFSIHNFSLYKILVSNGIRHLILRRNCFAIGLFNFPKYLDQTLTQFVTLSSNTIIPLTC